MTTPTETFIDEAIETTLSDGKEITGTDLGKKVEKEVEEKTTELRDQFGDAVDDIVKDAAQDVKGYQQSLNELVGDHLVGDTASEGAAGYNDKGDGNKVVISEEAAKREVEDREYWEGVRVHEEQHQNEQTFNVNQQEVQYVDSSGSLTKASVIGNLTERDAIRAARQPDDHLVPEYVEHAEIGDEVVEIAGEQEVSKALKSGDVQELQKVMFEKQREQVLELLLKGEMQPEQVALAA